MITVTEVEELLEQGYNDTEIGNVLGCSKYKIHRFRKANNIPNSITYKKQKQIRDIEKYMYECHSRIELAEKLNISISRMGGIIKENELDIKFKNVCKRCNKEFVGKSLYCSDKCKNMKTLKCEICGKEFESDVITKTCGDSKCVEELKKLREQHNRIRGGIKNNALGSLTEKYKCKKSNVEKLTVNDVVELLKQGMNDTEIGLKLGCTTSQICNFRNKNNIPTYKYYLNQKQVEEINKVIKKCNTVKELSETLNIPTSTLYKCLKRNNIEIKKEQNFRKRKFGTWTIKKRYGNDVYLCECDCGNVIKLSKKQIVEHSNKCPSCKLTLSITKRKKQFLADYRRSERVRRKELQKRGKTYTPKVINSIDDIGRDTYVNLLCSRGHMTKNKFSTYNGCNICK